ncbi:MAG: TIGR03663 family protein [Kiritimatiellae bacterium]|nr:TIGR03663 family protein [Kiritimatiellia bacterium]
MKKNESILRILWLTLAILLMVTRFYQPGTRAMSHDESLHAYYAWNYAEKGEYVHDPMMHGPLLFHLNAAVYWLFGASDATSRLAPALAGTLAVLTFFLFRRWITPRAAWICALLALIAPDLWFYSRYIRNEAYVMLLLLIWIYALFRYLENPRCRWLFAAAIAMSLSFSCKEVSFMHAAIIAAFLFGLAMLRALRRQTSAAIAATDLLLLTAALPLPFATPLVHQALGRDPLDYSTPDGILYTLFTAFLLAAVSLAGLFIWYLIRRRHAARAAAVFWTQSACLLLFWTAALTLFTSFFTNPLRGACSGISGSLGYWLAQHSVQRGSQPLYYYPMLLLLYNPLLLVCALPFFALRLPAALRAVFQRDNPSETFILFAGWWTLSAFILYSAAGERMPWLLVHISLPLCLISGITLNDLLTRIHERCGNFNRRAAAILAVPLVLYYLLKHLPASTFGGGRTIPDIINSMNWIRSTTALLFLAALLILTLNRKSARLWRCYLPAGFLLLLLAFAARNSLRHNTQTYDLPTETLVFAHGSDMLHPLMREIHRIQATQYNPKAPVVAYDQESAWPLTWYMRDLPNTFFTESGTNLLTSPVILCGTANRSAIKSLTGEDWEEFTVPMIWWPLQDYMRQTPSTIIQLLCSPERRRTLWAAIDRRQYTAPLTAWPLRHDLFVFIRNNKVSDNWRRANRPPAPPPALEKRLYGIATDRSPDRILAGTYEGKTLNEPRAAIPLADGGFAIADTGNNRVVILNPDASLRRVLSPTPPFYAPWGLTEGDHGFLYVADTWNGQIRVFSPDGKEINTWGRFALCTDYRADPENLYGPRGLAWNPTLKHLIIADTGNRRILIYAHGTTFLAAYGPFSEPVNVACSAGGAALAVSDVWNRRIVLLDLKTGKNRYIPAPFWNYRNTSHKPSVALDAHGFFYASAPDRNCVIKMDAQGRPLEHFGLSGHQDNHMNDPAGLFADPVSESLFVCDAGNHRILIYHE